MRENILNCIIINSEDLSIVESLSKCIFEMIKEDGVEIWIEPLQEFKHWVVEEEEEGKKVYILNAYLTIFINLFAHSDQ